MYVVYIIIIHVSHTQNTSTSRSDMLSHNDILEAIGQNRQTVVFEKEHIYTRTSSIYTICISFADDG